MNAPLSPTALINSFALPSRTTLVVVAALAVGLPILAFVAAVSSGTNPDLITSGPTFIVVSGAAIAMLFEINRMADA